MIDEQTRATLSTLRGALAGNATFVQAAADVIQDLLDGEEVPVPQVPWTKDISSELARNPGPYASKWLNDDKGWWQRTLDQITGVTIHHTLSDSPHATANHYVWQTGGRPTIPYTIWVTQTGEVLLCVELEQGLWHDHTGHENRNLSIGMAGQLHKYRPSDAQLEATARVCAWAIQSDMLPGVTGPGQVQGHRDYKATICPGWWIETSGYWKESFCNVLESIL